MGALKETVLRAHNNEDGRQLWAASGTYRHQPQWERMSVTWLLTELSFLQQVEAEQWQTSPLDLRYKPQDNLGSWSYQQAAEV